MRFGLLRSHFSLKQVFSRSRLTALTRIGVLLLSSGAMAESSQSCLLKCGQDSQANYGWFMYLSCPAGYKCSLDPATYNTDTCGYDNLGKLASVDGTCTAIPASGSPSPGSIQLQAGKLDSVNPAMPAFNLGYDLNAFVGCWVTGATLSIVAITNDITQAVGFPHEEISLTLYMTGSTAQGASCPASFTYDFGFFGSLKAELAELAAGVLVPDPSFSPNPQMILPTCVPGLWNTLVYMQNELICLFSTGWISYDPTVWKGQFTGCMAQQACGPNPLAMLKWVTTSSNACTSTALSASPSTLVSQICPGTLTPAWANCRDMAQWMWNQLQGFCGAGSGYGNQCAGALGTFNTCDNCCDQPRGLDATQTAVCKSTCQFDQGQSYGQQCVGALGTFNTCDNCCNQPRGLNASQISTCKSTCTLQSAQSMGAQCAVAITGSSPAFGGSCGTCCQEHFGNDPVQYPTCNNVCLAQGALDMGVQCKKAVSGSSPAFGGSCDTCCQEHFGTDPTEYPYCMTKCAY